MNNRLPKFGGSSVQYHQMRTMHTVENPRARLLKSPQLHQYQAVKPSSLDKAYMHSSLDRVSYISACKGGGKAKCQRTNSKKNQQNPKTW